VATSRGVSFEHAKGTICTDAKFHRHCQGRWRGSVSLGFDAQGKRLRRRVTGRTKTECMETMTRLREELGQAPRSSRKYTVANAFEDWLADGLPGRSESTRGAYRSAAGPLVERIGHRPLAELTSSEVRMALDALTGRLSTRTLTIARQSLQRTVRFAMNHDRVARNVVMPVEVPTGRAARKSKSLDLAQAQALLKAAEASRWYGYIAVSLLSGLRTEEVRALRWEHVHLDDGPEAMPHIDVWRAERAGGDVKTPRSRRSLRLPALCVDALRKQREQQEQDRRLAGKRWQEHGLVFASAVGTPLLSGNVRRGFRIVCKRAGVQGQWTPRELRHTFVSLMSSTGMPVEEIARLVGHSSTFTTETVYRKELRPLIRSGADAMDRLFSAAKSAKADSVSPSS
jgi:integrase